MTTLPNKAEALELAGLLDNIPRVPNGDESPQPPELAAKMLRAYANIVPEKDVRDVLSLPPDGGVKSDVMNFLVDEADALGGAIISPDAFDGLCRIGEGDE